MEPMSKKTKERRRQEQLARERAAAAASAVSTSTNPQPESVVTTVNPPVVPDPTALAVSPPAPIPPVSTAATPAAAPVEPAPADPCDGQLTPELYQKERALILDLIKANTDQHDKAILQLTAATLAFSITFVDKVAKNPDPGTLPMLGWGWFALVVSMAAMVLSFLTGQKACAKRLAALDNEYSTGTPDNSRNFWAMLTTTFNYTSSTLFFVGLILILLFSWVNMPNASKGNVTPPETSPTAPKDVVPPKTDPTPGGPSCTSWRFSWKKWKRWLDRRRIDRFLMPDAEQFSEIRQVRTHLSGWRWSSFCKTQYASDPRCGGAANFLRCHISVVTLLDRIAKLPTLAIEMDDEGRYGPSKYSDDWKQARAEGREPTYPWHKGKYDPKALVAEVGDWNQLIASFAGAFKDAARKTGFDCESAIAKFPNFESLEFRGSQDKRVKPFLAALKGLVEQTKPNDESSATGT